jgi:N-acetylglucosamine-6-phosphate deacetylase
MKAIVNGKILHNRQVVEGQTLYFDDRIVSISPELPERGCECIDANGAYVSAGFVDIHIHGSGGADVMDATPEALETISRTLLKTGTTSFVATTMTMPQSAIIGALETVRTYGPKVSGAKIAGIHLEGPFINPVRSGAQDSSHIQEPTLDWLMPYLNLVRVITIAPEIKGAQAFIETVKEAYPHILLSIGHSNMDYEGTLESFSWGISHATHLFNAMPSWHHRKPGIVGAVFDSKVTADIIADLIHTHPSILGTVEKVIGERVILITDAMRAGCMKSGAYDLGGQRVTVKEGRAELDNGVLAGSVLKLNEAVRHYYVHTEATLAEAVFAATTLPAKRLGLPRGSLKRGYDADIVIFDEDVNVQSVYVDGELKWR